MARYNFGGGPADMVIKANGDPYPGAVCTVWTAASGGTQITDLQTTAGVAITSVTSDDYGLVAFKGPDDATHTVYLDSPGDSPRTRITAWDYAAGGGSGTVTSVTAGDTTITVGGTATDPTIKAATGTSSGTVAAGDHTHTAYVAEATATTKGDLLARSSTALTRLGVGTNDYVLTADSTATTGMKWAAAPTGLPSNFVTKTTTYAAAVGDYVQCDTSSAGFTVTLPSGPAAGAVVAVQKTSSDAHILTIVPSGSGNIDGDASATTTVQDAGALFQHVGSDVWHYLPIGPVSDAAGALLSANNLSDVAAAATARTNLGLGTAATVDTGTGSGNIPLLGESGTLAVARLATGTPDGSKFVRDDGALAVPAGDLTTNVLAPGNFARTSAWHQFEPFGMNSGRTLTQSIAYMGLPIYIPRAMTISKLGVYVQSGTASSTIRLGLYTATGLDIVLNSAWGTLLVDGGTVDSSTSGKKEVTLGTPQGLTAGTWVFAVAVAQGANASPWVSSAADVKTPQMTPWGQSGPADGPFIGAYTANSITGALPSSLTPTTLTQYGSGVYVYRSA